MLRNHWRINEQWSLLGLWHRLSDALALLAATRIVLPAAAGSGADAHLLLPAAAIVVYYLAGELTGLYRSWQGVSLDHELACSWVTWLYTVPVLVVLGYFSGQGSTLPRETAVTWLIVAPLGMSLLRWLIRSVQQTLRSKGFNTRGFAIVGVTDLGFELARNIERAPHMGLRLVGFFDDRPAARTPRLPADVGQRVGDLDELLEQARRGAVSIIYITFPMRAERRIKQVLDRLGDTTASVYLAPDFFVYELLHSRWTNIGGLPVVSVFENPFYGVDGLLKRAADLCLATLFLLIAAVPMLVIAAAIKLTSRGPVFFRQERYGLDGRPIRVWKFRTMCVCEEGEQVVQATKNDPRITPLGGLLRKTSLDEVPQLFNVLDGSMSLVGPRPHASTHNEAYRKMIQGYMLRHKVKPGITGLAQVNGWRGETDTLYKMQKRVEFDHQYIRDWSPWLDLKILAQTVVTVLKHKNAY
jgi:putative colanic acid biosynthesis UDP-glucose lipid carrier transferase